MKLIAKSDQIYIAVNIGIIGSIKVNSNYPLKEEFLLAAALEPTNKPHALAKIPGIKLFESLRNRYDLMR